MSARPGWRPAVLLVLAVNALALAGWAWNGRGDPVAVVELSEREMPVVRGGEENSSVRLLLQHRRDDEGPGHPPWADAAALVALGFAAEQVGSGDGTEVSPRLPTRRSAWVLLRVDAPVGDSAAMTPRLVPVALGDDPGALYRASGDRGSHLVLRGIVTVRPMRPAADSLGGPASGETWFAAVDLLSPTSLHVPRSLVPALDRLAPDGRPAESPRYRVRLALGRLHLPRVTAVFPVVQ